MGEDEIFNLSLLTIRFKPIFCKKGRHRLSARLSLLHKNYVQKTKVAIRYSFNNCHCNNMEQMKSITSFLLSSCNFESLCLNDFNRIRKINRFKRCISLKRTCTDPLDRLAINLLRNSQAGCGSAITGDIITTAVNWFVSDFVLYITSIGHCQCRRAGCSWLSITICHKAAELPSVQRRICGEA